MHVTQLFDEIRVYAGAAARTGVQFERDTVRRSGGCCRSLTELIRKARDADDGYYYLPLDLWPVNTIASRCRRAGSWRRQTHCSAS